MKTNGKEVTNLIEQPQHINNIYILLVNLHK